MQSPKPDLLKDLIQKTQKILKDLNHLKLTMPSSKLSAQVSIVKEKFNFLQKNWESFSVNLEKKIKEKIQKNREKRKKIEGFEKLDSRVLKSKKRIKSQEIVIERKERLGSESCRKVKKWWRNSLSDMENSSGLQYEIVERISQDNLERYEKMEEDFEATFRTFMMTSSSETCEKREKKKRLEKNFRNFNPFLNGSDDIESFRMMKNQRKKEKYRNEVESETFHDSVNLQEVKKALHILKKANLLDNNGNSALLKIAEMMKNPENSSNFELVLQLIELENQKNKPEQGKKMKRKQEKVFFEKEAAFFESSLENSITRGLLSANHPLNSDRIFEHQLRDVDLDEILKVESIHEQIDLLPASGSFWEELNEGVIFSQEDSKMKNGKEISLNDFPLSKLL